MLCTRYMHNTHVAYMHKYMWCTHVHTGNHLPCSLMVQSSFVRWTIAMFLPKTTSHQCLHWKSTWSQRSKPCPSPGPRNMLSVCGCLLLRLPWRQTCLNCVCLPQQNIVLHWTWVHYMSALHVWCTKLKIAYKMINHYWYDEHQQYSHRQLFICLTGLS